MSPIGSKDNPFKGTYNGNYCTINAISINNSIADTGVFGFIDDAAVQNLSVHGIISSSVDNVGGIIKPPMLSVFDHQALSASRQAAS